MLMRPQRNQPFSLFLLTGLLAALFADGSVGMAATPEAAQLYAKKPTWQETMIASRANCARQQEQAVVELGPWYTTGPLNAKDFADAFFPEEGVDLAAKGPDGQPLWQKGQEWGDGLVHNLPAAGNSASTYLSRTITAKEPGALEAGLGSDDGLEVWLNGEKLLSNNVARGPGADQDHVVFELKAGENRLLLKIYNRSGGHGFYFGLGEPKPLPGLWQQIEKDFPVRAGWMKRHLPQERHLTWFHSDENADLEKEMIDRALKELGNDGQSMRGDLDQLTEAKVPADDPRWLELYERVCLFRYRPAELKQVNTTALRLALEDLTSTFGGKYARGSQYLKQLAEHEKRVGQIEMALARGERDALKQVPSLVERFDALRREALLANPLLEFNKLLVVKRRADKLGLPQNWQGNCAIAKTGYDNEIAIFSPVSPKGNLSTFFRPEKGEFVGDVDLDFNADKMLFSMPGTHGRWQIWEIGANGQGLRQVTPGEYPDVDNYDACYLPDGRIIFGSTRCFHGVPCVGGGNTVANLCIMNADGSGIRQLCFDQDHNWCPTVLNNGRVLYSRWEYSDTPHYFSRLIFHMNPDGTNQLEYYASNSMWPNSTFYARPIPNHPTRIIGVISGHHGVPRMGELILFDPSRGRHEASGVVQRIPGYGQKVEPIIRDGLVNGSWPKFLHPYPLNGNYFLVSCQPTSASLWGIYLVDVFDNALLIKEEPGYVLFEPVPFRKTPTPPVIPDKVRLEQDEATVYLSDVYLGRGLAGVPQGTVKKLRLYEPHYAYPGMGGHINIGIDGPWDVHRILGTVPVERDGSASFRVPANIPIAVQPLDADGKAVQIMRSWFTAMPGEVLSCTGCHESQNTTPPSKMTLAARRPASPITPWYGPARGFGFKREVQPVLDRYCVGCHDGQSRPDGKQIPDFTAKSQNGWRNFTPSYVALHPYVRRPGPESDYHMQVPLEFHAGTSELIQMLEKGHHNVKLDAEAWDRLITWIDLNVPDHGTWTEHRGISSNFHQRRLEMRTLYANRPEDPEAIDEIETAAIEFVKPSPMPERKPQNLNCPGWPFNADEAKRRQAEAGEPNLRLELAQGVVLELVLVPAGEFVMGSAAGGVDEYPLARVKIERPFYMGKLEITNAQYALFDPGHDSAYISMTNKDQNHRGHAVNGPTQPVVRVSWEQAVAFCRWLSAETGQKFALPTEAQWEWACRAGTNSPLSYGGLDSDFSKFANVADAALERFAQRDSPKWHPRDQRFNDGAMVTTNAGRYQPNAWGLCDLHGNAAEWTQTTYRPYPYNARDGRDNPAPHGAKSVRGGSWYDRPARARSSFRLDYEPWQRVYNVGFRVVMQAE